MEMGRVVLAIALSFVVFLVWQFMFVDKNALKKPLHPTEKTEPATTAKKIAKTPQVKKTVSHAEKQAEPVQAPAAEVPPEPALPARLLTVQTPLYMAKLSTRGAVIKDFVLKKYREKVDPNSPLKTVLAPGLPEGNPQIGLLHHKQIDLKSAVFNSPVARDSIDVAAGSQVTHFLWRSPQGLVVEKSYRFDAKSYLIQVKVTLKNQSAQPIEDNLYLSLFNRLSAKRSRYGFEGASAYVNGKLKQIATGKIKKKHALSGNVQWLAIESQYFMTSLVFPDAPQADMRLFLHPKNLVESRYISPALSIAAGAQQTFDFNLFVGPKSLHVLRALDNQLDKAVNFGWFDILAKPCLWLMNQLYRVIPNYGVAIIILTILIKIVLWPLGTKSYRSMSEMKKLQPLMAEIRQKYKGDKKKMNEELMGLYKTYKINPMGGCLPMVVQIPVFFALYRMLYQAIELRHAPFFLWINDLSAPDRLLRFHFSIPFMQPPYGIPVLTIIMGATMFWQQKMSPPVGDPSQAKMMMMMPVIFTVIFINFSSGLVLYWLVNNVLSIGQQYYIQKKYA